MRRSVNRVLRVGVLGAAVAGLLLTATPALAAPNPQDPIPNTMLDKDNSGTVNTGDIVVAIAGSDTTWDVMNSVIASMPTKVKSHVFHVGPILTPPPAALTVPADANCAQVVYDPAESGNTDTSYLTDADSDGRLINPNGSGQGRTALVRSADPAQNFGSAAIDTGNGCIDIARSSAFVSTTNLEYFGFGLDAVGWGTTSMKAPTSLTMAQLRAIYKCDAASENDSALGLTTAQKNVDADDRINNWAEVGGAPGKISRVLPQAGSGTREMYLAAVLGNSSSTAVAPDGLSAFGCDDVLLVQENDGSLLTSGNSGANVARLDEYILGYSVGKWAYQVKRSDNKTLDVRGGVRMGAITRVKGTSTCPTSPLTFEDSTFQAAFPIRFNGSDYLLNSGTPICFNYVAGSSGTPVTVTTQDYTTTPGDATVTKTNGVTASGLGDTTLDSGTAGTFTSGWVGLQLSGPCIADGTTITATDGQVLTISPSAQCAITPATVLVAGITPINEFNPVINSQTNVNLFPGVRFVYNVVHVLSPNYDEAVNLVGFTADGNSPMCNGTNEGEIADNGFQPLPKVANSGSSATTCRKRT